MGDRCYLTMQIRRSDAHNVEEFLGDSPLDHEQFDPKYPGLEWQDDEANYAITDDRGAMAEAGIVFIGRHGEGGNYPGYEFASDGKEMRAWELSTGGSDYVLRARKSKIGKREYGVRGKDLQYLNSYVKFYAKCEKLLLQDDAIHKTRIKKEGGGIR